MKLLADENFPKASVLLLRRMGYDITFIGEDYQGISDSSVIKIAEQEQRLILTFDRDYGELIFKHGFKPEQGVLYLRLTSYTPEYPAQVIHKLLSELGFATSRSLTVYDGEIVRQRKY